MILYICDIILNWFLIQIGLACYWSQKCHHLCLSQLLLSCLHSLPYVCDVNWSRNVVDKKPFLDVSLILECIPVRRSVCHYIEYFLCPPSCTEWNKSLVISVVWCKFLQYLVSWNPLILPKSLPRFLSKVKPSISDVFSIVISCVGVFFAICGNAFDRASVRESTV